jgi:hypothetical protein
VTRQKDEIEAIFYLVDAIFYGDTRHRLVTPVGGTCSGFSPLGISGSGKFQVFLSWIGQNPLLGKSPGTAVWPIRFDIFGPAGPRGRQAI